MAKVLTEEQRAAKRARDIAYRARKRAEASGITVTDVSDTTEPVATDEVETITFPKAETLKDFVLRAKKGAEVESPVGSLTTFVVQKYRNDGARLLTSDGNQVNRNEDCTHEDVLADPSKLVYFEVTGGQFDGDLGWVHRVRGCNKVVTRGVDLPE